MANSKTNKELPFGIDFVVNEDLNADEFKHFKAANGSYDINCPFCGGRRKMNINTTKNVARCNKCGGLKGFNAITLHAQLTGLDNKESYKDLMKRWQGLDSDVKASFKGQNVQSPSKAPASIEIRDRVYRRMLSCLTLSEEHKKDLLKRGLTEKQIEQGLYRSLPISGFHAIAYRAIYEEGLGEFFAGRRSIGVPGFIATDNPEKISLCKRKVGFLIPVIQKDGLISGLQIRYDNLPSDATEEERMLYNKYSWFSSSENTSGCSISGCENIHFAGDWSKIPDVINITEGVLKADIASALSGKPFLGLIGVNNLGQLEKTLVYLQILGVTSVRIYIDMDYQDKKEVAAALLGIRRIINRAGEHSYQLVNQENGYIRVSSSDAASASRRIVFGLNEEFLLSDEVELDGIKLNSDDYQVQDNKVMVNANYMNDIRTGRHTLSVKDKKGRDALKDVAFTKSGMSYQLMNWNSKYKGIDDYYLSLIKSKENSN